MHNPTVLMKVLGAPPKSCGSRKALQRSYKKLQNKQNGSKPNIGSEVLGIFHFELPWRAGCNIERVFLI